LAPSVLDSTEEESDFVVTLLTPVILEMYKGMNQTAAQHLLSSMLPYDSMGGMGLYEQTKPSLMYRVPRVIPDQKGRFESDELFRRLSRESEVRAFFLPYGTVWFLQ
jgi:Core binding factor beta subunit